MSLIREYMGTDAYGIEWYRLRFGPVVIPAECFTKQPNAAQALVLNALGIPRMFLKEPETKPDNRPTL